MIQVLSELLSRAELWQRVETVLITGATLLLVVYTGRYVKLTNKLAAEAEARSYPSVYVDVELEGNDEVLFLIGNAGPTPAHDIRLQVSDNVAWDGLLEETLANMPVFQNGLSYLAPGRKIRYRVGLFDWEGVNEGRSLIRANVQYCTSVGRQLSSSFKIDLRLYEGSYAPLLQEPLERIAGSVQEICYLKDREHSAAEAKQIISQIGPPRVACRSCCEQISSTAKKCPHCLEFLVEGQRSSLLVLLVRWLGQRGRRGRV
jgi:hypothetical protein